MKNKQKEWHSAFKPLKNNLSGFPSDCQMKYIFPFVCLFQLTFYHFDFSSKLFTVFRRSRVLNVSSRKRLAVTCKALMSYVLCLKKE
jgi:hypothetical protein